MPERPVIPVDSKKGTICNTDALFGKNSCQYRRKGSFITFFHQLALYLRPYNTTWCQQVLTQTVDVKMKYFMKKFIVCLSVIIPLLMAACSDKKPETKKEVIIVPASPAPAPAPAAATREKNTTIVLDKNGVKVGTPKVDVTINPEKKN
jgi:hypothetical protein